MKGESVEKDRGYFIGWYKVKILLHNCRKVL